MKNMKFYYVKTVLICWKTYISIFILIIMCTLDFNPNRKLTLCQSTTDLSTQIMYHLLVPNVVRKACISNMYICSLIGFNSYFVLYLMCCFGNNLCIWISNQCKFCSVIGRLIAIYRHFQQLHTYCIRRKPVLLLVEIRILYKSTELTRQ